MDRGAWQATVHGVPKSLDTTELLSMAVSGVSYTIHSQYMFVKKKR